MWSDDNVVAQNTKNSNSAENKSGLSNVDEVKNNFISPSCLADPVWDLLDPLPDIKLLFISFDSQFFGNTLGAVEVKWSTRMTLCAGVCRFHSRQGACSISLSEPLLKFRPRKDLVETLLHEMIHAFLFVTRRDKDRDDHGPNFKSHMHRINSAAGVNITVYHSFHDEVDAYRTHWWRCTGPCRSRPPYFGYVKRSMNRVPGPRDVWWGQHQATCTGTFIKIKEPEKKIPSKRKTTTETRSENQIKQKKQAKGGDIRNFITINNENENTVSDFLSQSGSSQGSSSSKYTWPSDEKGRVLGGGGWAGIDSLSHRVKKLIELKSSSSEAEKQVKGGDIRNFITINSENENTVSEFLNQSGSSEGSSSSKYTWPSDDKGHVLGGAGGVDLLSHQVKKSIDLKPSSSEAGNLTDVSCPCCTCIIPLSQINEHLDVCLS